MLMDEEKKVLRLLKRKNLSTAELEKILKSVENKAPIHEIQSYKDYFQKRIRFGVFSDSHIGVREFDENFFKYMVQVFKREKLDRVYQCGDILEGMSGRPGHIYELTDIGFNNQMNRAVRLFKTIHCPVFGIDGNHDEWYQRKNDAGIVVGNELQSRVPNYTNLGQMEANVKLSKNITMKLFHPNDGSAYAVSYKLQKLIESFTGGEKPNIILQGHYHKALYMFNRNVHGLECGTLSGQSKFMRGRKLAAHKGFWIVDLEIGKEGIGSFSPRFYPGYK